MSAPYMSRFVHIVAGAIAALAVGPSVGAVSAQSPFGDPLEIAAIRDFLPAHGFGEKHPDAPPEIEQFGQLVGIWVAEQEMLRQDSTWVVVGEALWAWRYALGGFATRDLWYQSADNLPAYLGNLGRDYLLSGTRIYSPAAKQWEVSWVANGLGTAPGQDAGGFQAVWEDDRLVMTALGDWPQRVIFSDFEPDSFLWTSEGSQDGGETWVAYMRAKARRVR